MICDTCGREVICYTIEEEGNDRRVICDRCNEDLDEDEIRKPPHH